MDINKACDILIESITRLSKRSPEITVANAQADVINNACLYILKEQKKDLFYGQHLQDAKLFIDASIRIFQQFREVDGIILMTSIQNNLAWDGMWDFLRTYFYEKHGIHIDEKSSETLKFYSNSHKRIENGTITSEDEVARIVVVQFIGENKEEVLVSIEPSLSPKKGKLLTNKENILTYEGYDPDYLFHIKLDLFNEVEFFTLELPNRKLAIEYYE
ncbi:hypothetical protein [Aureispira anguillae]|uniref:Uncharacterized protein n=1 Tax=Aureispira anguillae TaxID=2864201 RepID=A0A915YAY2_9BACT|nr:hypothetical protein [Aureispira anguillae]BDS09585.1 hypothetical protein AsAng_0002890 [Aureispira anguillae]